MLRNNNSARGTKIIAVTGGVISGLGKGAVTGAIGALLQTQGLTVSAVKIDPYINVDAGTMRPTEHGEVWVTGDGGETDQDLGTYERFLGKDLGRKHSITTGQVFEEVIRKERNLEYGGQCVQVIPHIPNEVERRIRDVAKEDKADVVLVETGGVVGDYENILYLEAFRRMHLAGEPIIFVHVVYLPVPSNLGEMKSKPAQHSVRMLNEIGIQPDFLVARAEKPLDEIRRGKLAVFCTMKKEHIISDPDVNNVYELPLLFERQGVTEKLLGMLNLPYKKGAMKQWEGLMETIQRAQKPVRVGIVGKYFDTGDFTLMDSYISVIEAVKHAGWACGRRPEIVWVDAKKIETDGEKALAGLDGIIVPGGFGSTGVEGKMQAIRYCREKKIPYLGLCYGLQLAVIEFARNVCGMAGANTTENGSTAYPVVDILAEQKKVMEKKLYGGTMRLGNWEAKLTPGTVVAKLYRKVTVVERHRHRYEVNPAFIGQMENKGLVFSGRTEGNLVEYIELPGQFFVGTQAHPEFTSRPLAPNPLFLGFVKAAGQKD